jgi:hypothetical protein
VSAPSSGHALGLLSPRSDFLLRVDQEGFENTLRRSCVSASVTRGSCADSSQVTLQLTPCAHWHAVCMATSGAVISRGA